jgi:hypothetical protein
MTIDCKALFILWKLEDLPACETGMTLAITYLENCVDRLDSRRTQRAEALSSRINAAKPRFRNCKKLPVRFMPP